MGALLTHASLTSEICAQCEEDLIEEEDVIVVQVMRPEILNGVPQLVPILDEEGDFQYEHYFLHFKCWEELAEGLKEEVQNTPPVPDELSLLSCECCGSAIREYEPIMGVTLGELIRSKRSPSGDRGFELYASEAPDVFCLTCLGILNESYITFWDDGVTISGECLECQFARCWRGFDCGCICHPNAEEGES